MNRQIGPSIALGGACLALGLCTPTALGVGLPTGAGNLSGSHLILSGESNGDRLGQAVLGDADFNGDGHPDIAIAAPRAGKVYVIFGGVGPLFEGGGISVGVAADQILTLQSTSTDSEHYALTATDLDKDGKDDLVIGNPYYGASDTGRVWVVYGDDTWGNGDSTNIESAPSSAVLTITTTGSGAQMGYALAGGRNLNESSASFTEDLLIGTPGSSKAFMVYGKSGRPSSIQGSKAISTFTGSTANGGAFNGVSGARLGEAVAIGPYFTDPTNRRSAVVLGAPGSDGSDGSPANCGAVYGYLPGGSGYPANTDSISGAEISYTSGCVFGPFRIGTSVHLADINGDGSSYPDLVFGGPTAKNNGDSEAEAEGRIWLRFGSSDGPDLTIPGFGSGGYPNLQGDPSEQLGQTIASADIDGDGVLDAIFGSANPADGSGSGWSWASSAGQVYIYLSGDQNGGVPYGLPDTGSEGVFVGNLDYASAVLQGESSGEDSGASISGAGDLFNSGNESFLVGAPSSDVGGTNRGRVYLYVPNSTVDQDGDGYTISAGDCDDGDPKIFSDAVEICEDGIDQDCNGSDLSCSSEDNDEDGFTPAQGDCDDTDPDIRPNALEACNGVDDNCNGATDEGLTDTYYPDGDGDGFGTSPGVELCGLESGYATVGSGADEDCDDNRGSVYPGASEACNGRDDDCDDTLDEGVGTSYYTDSDGDGYGDPNSDQSFCSNPGTGYSSQGGDCDDSDGSINPDTEWYNDGDSDGYGADDTLQTQCQRPTARHVQDGGDCNDSDGDTYPGASEICDGEDNDCNGVVPANESDGDNDNYRVCDGDCNDGDRDINPDERELCDEKDNDCNGQVDEGVQDTYYADLDEDSFGDPGNTTLACSLPSGYVNDSRDCDDSNPLTYTGAPEQCDGEDNNCDGNLSATAGLDETDADGDSLLACADDCDDTDGSVGTGFTEICDDQDNDCDLRSDEGFDSDGDGYYTCLHGGLAADCDDNDSSTSPGAGEICDGKDNNCNGTFEDERGDQDGDGFSPCPDPGEEADCNDTAGVGELVYPGADEICDGQDSDCDGILPDDEQDVDGDDYRVCDGDCDDTDSVMSPALDEICDGKDNDCNGDVDDGVLTTYYADGDGDGAGDPTVSEEVCIPSDGYVTNSRDCDDTNPDTYQGAGEICDGEDNNCDGEIPTTESNADGDPFLFCEGDCNDNDGDIYPANPEICDGKDNDCNSVIDEGFDEDGKGGADCIDDDGDGFSEDDGDCDDTNSFIYLGADEIGDQLDNDCDLIVDEGLGDTDDDGDGYSENDDDCDDDDEFVFPGAAEVCGDGIDNNCNDVTDEGCEEAGFFATCSTLPSQGSPRSDEVLGLLAMVLVGLGFRRRHG